MCSFTFDPDQPSFMSRAEEQVVSKQSNQSIEPEPQQRATRAAELARRAVARQEAARKATKAASRQTWGDLGRATEALVSRRPVVPRGSRAAAEAAASKACAHLAKVSALRVTNGWIPVVLLRQDQGWLAEKVAERGVLINIDQE